ncbi:DUF6161 domain-containing protein [Vibrio ziniensis]|uniref:DUF6161 domain-containing protein n=1 Tax=Vibrio ziniensis TaxID=2711221 RepID=A0A6G7CH79_9VIBR|nr:DUF6161 domain-containing protein [Vibrio ziniensis]QIH41434.1 hypothetical protein G5S32_05245 [Vibrio ziniensis]
MEYKENYVVKGLFDTSIHFDSTEQLGIYVEGELENFTSISKTYKGQLTPINNIINHLTNLKLQISFILQDIAAERPINPSHRNNVQANINTLSSMWAPHGHSVFERLKYVYDEYNVAGVQSFWPNVIGGFQQPGNHLQMMGALAAYDYLRERKSITELSNSDRDFIEQNYTNAIEKGNELEETRKSLEKRAINWEAECQKSWSDWEHECNDIWASLTSQKNSEWESDRSIYEAEHDESIEAAKKKISELEATYQEHLKLEKPAQYWSNTADKYSNHSFLYGVLLSAFVFVGLVVFFIFYRNFLEGHELGIQLDTIKGVVLFVTGIAVYGFFLRVLAKLFMSTTHLQRDAEERAQLTYFYLALIKDGAIDEKSRDIVIQSLFSRTETGLISGDSSPTMPAMDVLKNIKIGS